MTWGAWRHAKWGFCTHLAESYQTDYYSANHPVWQLHHNTVIWTFGVGYVLNGILARTSCSFTLHDDDEKVWWRKWRHPHMRKSFLECTVCSNKSFAAGPWRWKYLSERDGVESLAPLRIAHPPQVQDYIIKMAGGKREAADGWRAVEENKREKRIGNELEWVRYTWTCTISDLSYSSLQVCLTFTAPYFQSGSPKSNLTNQVLLITMRIY